MKYKVRFNLGNGSRYMTWKIEDIETKKSIYLQPEEVSLILIGCQLKNNKNRAEEIFLGSHKTVCAWVLCERILIDKPREVKGVKVSYNPRKIPHWVVEGKDVDNQKFKQLKTKNSTIYYE